MKAVEHERVVCTALNDALLDGLLTVIHSERDGDGMSSLQVWRTSSCTPDCLPMSLCIWLCRVVLAQPMLLHNGVAGLKVDCQMQTDLPLLTEVDEAAIKSFTREFEVS